MLNYCYLPIRLVSSFKCRLLVVTLFCLPAFCVLLSLIYLYDATQRNYRGRKKDFMVSIVRTIDSDAAHEILKFLAKKSNHGNVYINEKMSKGITFPNNIILKRVS